jgi:hypothetical protein
VIDDLVELARRIAELVVNTPLFVVGQFLGLHQAVDVGAVTGVRRNAPGRGVRLHQVAARLELRHLVTHGCRADSEVIFLGERLGTDGLCGRDILVDYRREDIGLALSEIAALYHALDYSTPAPGVLAGEPGSARSIAVESSLQLRPPTETYVTTPWGSSTSVTGIAETE